jgi:hypothetical protein
VGLHTHLFQQDNYFIFKSVNIMKRFIEILIHLITGAYVQYEHLPGDLSIVPFGPQNLNMEPDIDPTKPPKQGKPYFDFQTCAHMISHGRRCGKPTHGKAYCAKHLR